jgi:murein DD-endopeptidase MepM/ murein hydrolase activator NlpD
MIGDPNAHPPEGVQYALPLPAGTRYELEQGFGGKFSHNDAENHYALDFAVPEGTPVLAARAGVVMQVEEGFRAHGTDPRFGDRANYVRVLHDDGSMAVYAHLAPASMLRRPGDHVVVGQLVGKSGNTGFSTGPHLHFSVQRNAGMSLVSMPFSVAGVDPAAARD